MKGRDLLIVAAVLAAAVVGARHFSGDGPPSQGLDGDSNTPLRAKVDVQLRLDFKYQHGPGGRTFADGEEGNVYLLGHVENRSDQRVEEVRLRIRLDDQASSDGAQEEIFAVGPLDPGERMDFDEVYGYLAPTGDDAYACRYDIQVLSVE